MTIPPNVMRDLAAADPLLVKWKVQNLLAPYDTAKANAPRQAIVVAYIDARDVAERLDKVCGLDWHARYRVPDIAAPDKLRALECHLTVFGVTRVDIGVAEGSEEQALKGVYSDALKRAGALFGVGRFVYRLPRVKAQVDVRQNKDKKDTTTLSRAALQQLDKLTQAVLSGQEIPALPLLTLMSDYQLPDLPAEVGAVEAAPEEIEDVLLAPKEAALLHKHLGMAGIPDHYAFATEALTAFKDDLPKIESFTQLSTNDAEIVREAARAVYRQNIAQQQAASN